MDEKIIEFIRFKNFLKKIEPQVLHRIKETRYVEQKEEQEEKMYQHRNEAEQSIRKADKDLADSYKRDNQTIPLWLEKRISGHIEPVKIHKRKWLGVRLSATLSTVFMNGQEETVMSYSASPCFENTCMIDGSFSKIVYDVLIENNIQKEFPEVALPIFEDGREVIGKII